MSFVIDTKIVCGEPESIAEKILEILPQGSGVNLDWKYQITNQSIRFSNSFHNMDENGVYRGWSDFTVILPLHRESKNFAVCLPTSFSLEFNGKLSQKLADTYLLREYLEDTITLSFTHWLQ